MNTRHNWQLILGIVAVVLILGVTVTLVYGNAAASKSGGLPMQVTQPIQPITLMASSKGGGIVAEVHGRPGDRVAKGELLIRLESASLVTQRKNLVSALRITRAALESSKEMSALPAALRSTVVEIHPEVTAAEDRYIRALAMLDRASAPAERSAAQAAWNQASAKRTEVRARIGHSLSSGDAPKDLASMIPLIESRLRELDQVLADSEVRAPETSVIDILDLHIGDRLLPGSPAAVLSLPGEYFCEFPVSVEDAAEMAVGLKSVGTFQNVRFEWRVESLWRRTIPVALREDRQVAQEALVRARFSLANATPGSIAILKLPRLRNLK